MRRDQDATTNTTGLVPARSSLAIVVSSARGVTRSPLRPGETLCIGRSRQCEIVVDDEAISRRHAAIHAGEPPEIEDLGSRNGTVLLGRRLAARERTPMPVGCVAEVGAASVVVLRQHLPAPKSRAPRSRGGEAAAVVTDAKMRRLYALLDVIAPTQLSVMVLGETGTGKEVFAQALHARSKRAGASFLALNCAAIPDAVLESELFGYERGAFTGAVSAKPGLLEAADGGTVMLDEIGELSAANQAKLLRVLESGEVLRLGGLRPRRVDVRFVSATNRDPRAAVAAGRFRADLLFRLDGFTVVLPPLRDRRDDILPLARLFAERAARGLEQQTPRLSATCEKALLEHAWPGNVRELRAVVERAVVLSRGSRQLDVEHLVLAGADETASAAASGDPEKQRVLDALARTAGNQTEAAKLLGVSRQTLIKRLEALGIARPRKRALSG